MFILLHGPSQKTYAALWSTGMQICKGFRLGRALTNVYQCVHLCKKGCPLNACYLEHHLCYSCRGEDRIKQLQVEGCYLSRLVLHFDDNNHHVLIYCCVSTTTKLA